MEPPVQVSAILQRAPRALPSGHHIGDKIDDLVRRDAELEWHLLREVLRQVLRQHQVVVNRLEMRPDHLAEVREVRRFAVAVKKLSTELLLEKLDCARQGRLGHTAFRLRA